MILDLSTFNVLLPFSLSFFFSRACILSLQLQTLLLNFEGDSFEILLQVLAITEDLHDVHSLAKDAASVHRSLMENLTKVHLLSPYFISSPLTRQWALVLV